MPIVKRTFKKIGVKVIVKNSIEDTTLNAKEVLVSISSLRKNVETSMEDINKFKKNIFDSKQAIENTNKTIVQTERDLKDICKFEDWAKTLQLSLLKNLIEEVKDECFAIVTADYKVDNGISDEQNDLQKYRQYQQKIATHKKIPVVVSADLLMNYVFHDSMLEDPWKVK